MSVVEELEVRVGDHDLSELLPRLTPNGKDELQTCLCPKLRDFRMHVGNAVDNKIVVGFVKSRMSSARNNRHYVQLRSIGFTGTTAEPGLLLQVPDDLEVSVCNNRYWRRVVL